MTDHSDGRTAPTNAARTWPTPRTTPGWIALVEAEPGRARALSSILADDRHRVHAVESAHGLSGVLSKAPVELVLIDIHSTNPPVEQVLERHRLLRPLFEVVLLCDRGSVRHAVQWMDHGVFDYLETPFVDPHRVRATVRRALERRRLLARTKELERRLREQPGGDGLHVDPAAPARAGAPKPPASEAVELPLSLAAYERAVLVRALAEAHNDASRAAKLLGIGRSTFYRKLSRHRVDPAGAPQAGNGKAPHA